MQNDVLFRGTREGMVIHLGDQGSFAELLDRLADKLRTSGQFFQGAEVIVQVGQRAVSPAEEAQLAAVLLRYKLSLRQLRQGDAEESTVRSRTPGLMAGGALGASAATGVWGEVAAGTTTGAPAPAWVEAEKPLVIQRTVRSGQSIQHRGDVIILGDVNPGAEVIADGHIVVLGTLRGVAHAGANGDETSIVTATRLQPTQLRIGRLVGRPPDNDQVAPGPELARVHAGQIVIESRAG